MRPRFPSGIPWARIAGALAAWSYGISLALSAGIGALLLAWALSPHCTFEGAVSGEVAPFWYSLSILGRPVRVDTLDSLRLIAFPVVALSIYLLLLPLASRRLGWEAGLELTLGGALAYLSLGVVPPMHWRIQQAACSALDVDLVYTTSAGVIDFGPTVLHTSWRPFLVVADPRVYVVAAALYALLASIGFLCTHGHLGAPVGCRRRSS